jgi:hypothetical protein
VIHNGTDPGEISGGQEENTLDVEWSGASAPGAQIALVVSKTTSTTFGGDLSTSYIVDNKVAPITSASYGGCELGLGTAGNVSEASIYQQAVTQGISAFVSSGDQGSAGCTSQDGTPPYGDQYGLQVNGMASVPYVTAVGGTDLNWNWATATGYETYWSTSNGSHYQNALGYIPEVPWNSTCTSTVLEPLVVKDLNVSGSEDFCNQAARQTNNWKYLAGIGAGSGGPSHCTSSDGNTPSSCSGGYAKPSWQSATGVPADGKRDVPDVSLMASSGIPQSGYFSYESSNQTAVVDSSALLYCEGGSSDTSCNLSEVGGTSASSPAMAGIMAVVVQSQGGAWQGLANPVLYALARKETYANCATASVSNSGSCVFNDITSGTNAQLCNKGDPNCVTAVSTDTFGILSGYNSTVGYDLTTGLGSVNVANLVKGWSGVLGAPAVSLTPTSLGFGSIAVGATSAASTVTVKNTGTAALSLSSIAITGTGAGSFQKTATTCGSSLSAGSSCTVSVAFKPAAAGALTASLKITDNASGSPQAVTLSGTGVSVPVFSLSATALSFPVTTAKTVSETQSVTVKNTGRSAASISSIALGGANPTDFIELSNCGSSLAAGASCTIVVAFKPAAASSYTATLSLKDTASGSPQKVTLSGTGVAAPALTLSATSLSFGTVKKGTVSAPKLVTATNAGKTTVSLASIALTGSNAGSFLELDNCGPTLAPAASCTLWVAFTPTATGAQSAKVTLTGNAAGSPQSIALSGTGN